MLGTLVKSSDTGQEKSEEWCKGTEIDPNVLHMLERKFFFRAALRRNLGDPPFYLE